MESKNTSITTHVSAPAEIVECMSLLNQIRIKVENTFKPSIEDQCDNIDKQLASIALDLSEIIKEHMVLDLYFERSKANNQQ